MGDDRLSYDVKLWDVTSHRGKRSMTYTVRWFVSNQSFQQTFSTRKLADSFRSDFLVAARKGVPFDRQTGIPVSRDRATQEMTWYEHACAFVDMKWARASARHRRSIAEALTNVTPVFLSKQRGAPDAEVIRRALYEWSFNHTARERGTSTPEIAQAVKWLAMNTLPLSKIADSDVIRAALDRLSRRLDGQAAAPATIARKRAVLYGALRYAVELRLLSANPIDQIHWVAPKDVETVDRRVVINPAQARQLFAAVRSIDPALEAFFACLYFAALRPGEAMHLHAHDCTLPQNGWGELHLTGSIQQVGSAWGDTGQSREEVSLKHRPKNDSRHVPASPELVQLLRRHIELFGCSPTGQLFVTRTGRDRVPVAGPAARPVSNARYCTVWKRARRSALTPAQERSPMAARPYDLRHAGVSLWLNAGVPPTQVAEWAGHGVQVLLKVYAKCIYGQDEVAMQRVQQALEADVAPVLRAETSERIPSDQP